MAIHVRVHIVIEVNVCVMPTMIVRNKMMMVVVLATSCTGVLRIVAVATARERCGRCRCGRRGGHRLLVATV